MNKIHRQFKKYHQQLLSTVRKQCTDKEKVKVDLMKAESMSDDFLTSFTLDIIHHNYFMTDKQRKYVKLWNYDTYLTKRYAPFSGSADIDSYGYSGSEREILDCYNVL